MNDDLQDFLKAISESFETNTLIKLTLSKVRSKSADLRNTFVRPVMIKKLLQLSFVYRYQTRDITENLSIDLALPKIEELLTNDFYQGNLFTTQEEIQWVINKKGSSRLIRSAAGNTAPLLQPLSHNRPKQRLITPENNIYLQALGVTNSRSEVVPAMNDKFRQINKFIEIIESILPACPPPLPPDFLKLPIWAPAKATSPLRFMTILPITEILKLLSQAWKCGQSLWRNAIP